MKATATIQATAEEIGSNWLPSVIASQDFERSLLSLRVSYLSHIAASQTADIAAADKVVDAAKQDLVTRLRPTSPRHNSERG